uniref:Pentatricopeptide repeat-containing protein n=1 Tax=Tanacetum cinerariifolium TaxID=118510 RepID=A0A699I8H0_TANCI|nr:pentatricopeptide repeat-containing protein [Tanacetum cinerariifolium]
MFIEFVIQNQFFFYSLEEFAQIVDIPCEGACVFTDKWSLDELAYGVPTDGPYQTNPPFPDDNISSIRIDQECQVCRIRHEEEINVLEYQILTREIVPTLKPLEEIIQENVFCLAFNLAYYMAKQMELVTRQKRLILPYGMLLTRLFKVIMNENHELYNASCVLYVRVMNPLSAQQERKPRKDRSTRRDRHSTSSSSAFDQLSQPKIFRTLNDYFTLTFLAATIATPANFWLISGHHPLLTIPDLHPIKTPPSPPYPQPPNHHTTTVYIPPSRHHHHPHTTLTLATTTCCGSSRQHHHHRDQPSSSRHHHHHDSSPPSPSLHHPQHPCHHLLSRHHHQPHHHHHGYLTIVTSTNNSRPHPTAVISHLRSCVVVATSKE